MAPNTAITDTTPRPGTARRRAAAAPAPEQTRERRLRVPTFAWVLLALIAGMAIGAIAMRQHNKAWDVVAAVNGTVIHKDDFFRRLQIANGPVVLHQMVGEELQLQFAQKKGLAPTDAEVEAAFTRMSRQPNFAQRLQATNQTVEDIKRALRIQLASAAVLGEGQKVTEADLHAFYEANINPSDPRSKFFTPAAISIAIIRTHTEAEGRKAMQDLHNGISFATVAKHYSFDPSKANGGLLPTFPRGRTAARNIPGFEETVFAMPVGSTLGPREFAGAWWIIHCLDKSAQVVPPFEKVKEDCRAGALVMKGAPVNAKKTQEEFTAFQKSARIQAFWPQYSQTLQVH
ncbi:MAG TPA: peptidyl-prolyl cis-trans isomerase [Chthonomonadaceae bacterium]|nr:peptidyl-prolyl cis-trans isomerase [Chthonomonadaceae bacterium]